jgi:3-oxoacyl-[acyl-carrier protein] reductase
MEDLIGKVALVTGASRGIGPASAIALAKADCDVAVNYRARGEEAAAVSQPIRAAGRRALAVCADVSRAKEAQKMATLGANELGAMSILVNNAGVARPQKIEDITEDDWNEIIDVNLKSTFMVTQAVLPGMRAQNWGRIINLSSVAAQTGGVVGPHYAASKAGMTGLTHSLTNLMMKEGITVNAIAPALIATEMVTSNPKANPENIPVGHFGEVDDVSSVVVLLAQNGYITGQTINLNGGWYFS